MFFIPLYRKTCLKTSVTDVGLEMAKRGILPQDGLIPG
jgi:hypothetical protein